MPISVANKTRGFIKLIRPQNIAPTLFLGFSGGWIMNRHFSTLPILSLMQSPPFWASIAITLSIMSASMVINDIFDIDIDRINHPTRPLVTGEIKQREAIAFSAFLLIIAEYFSAKYLPAHLHKYVHMSMIDIVVYSKLLKPVFLVKNISCASLIAFALWFSGFASITSGQYNEKNVEILRIGLRLVFFGSLHNEILMDVCDYEGDKKNGIATLPVVLNRFPLTWNIVFLFTQCNLLYNWIVLWRMHTFWKSLGVLLTSGPMLFYLVNMRRNRYANDDAAAAVKQSSISLFFTLVYLCWL
jgi:4-hydroxybenzoate polyprenyltransferase